MPAASAAIGADPIARERIIGLDRLLLSEIARIDEVFQRFEESVANRFVAGNEFRASLADVQSGMATRRELEAFQIEYRAAHASLVQALSDLRTSVAVGPKELAQLAQQADRNVGRREGIGASASALLAVTTIVIAIIGATAAIIIASHS